MAEFKSTDVRTFSEVIKLKERFEIPNFQRAYTWGNKELQDFFKSIVENNEEYFIGNIVTVDEKPLKIVDGQQRLTTISLLLCVIRDLFKNVEATDKEDKILVEQSEEMINSYLIHRDLNQIPVKINKTLFLGKDSYREVYEKIVDHKIDIIDLKELGDNEKRIINNYKILKKLLKDYIETSKISRLKEILGKTLSLQMILIICATDNDVYSIFEGFNSTGLGLSVADLVKNSILKQSKNNKEIQNNVETTWIEIEDMFNLTGISRFPKFLRHQWISENGYILMSNLFGEIRDKKVKNKTAEQIDNYILQLNKDAKIYMGMIFKNYERLLELDNIELDLFRKFRYLRNDQVYELLLTYYKAYKVKNLRKTSLKKYLTRIWIFVVRSRFISINPSEYEKIFASHCVEISEANAQSEIGKYFNIFIDKLKKLVSDNDQFVENFINDVHYGKDNSLIIEAFTSIMMKENVESQIRNRGIEHILPQEPRKWGLTKTEIREYVHNIGNLTLLCEKHNVDVSNDTIEKKAKYYSKSNFLINQEIASKWKNKFKKDWKSAIDERGKEIAKKVSEIWKL